MPRAQVSKAEVKLKADMPANETYQVQCWLQLDNGWDEASRRRNPMTPEQEAVVDQIHRLMHDNRMQLQMTIKKRIPGGDVKAFPATCYADLYVNEPQERQQPQNRDQGGDNGSSWTSLA